MYVEHKPIQLMTSRTVVLTSRTVNISHISLTGELVNLKKSSSISETAFSNHKKNNKYNFFYPFTKTYIIVLVGVVCVKII